MLVLLTWALPVFHPCTQSKAIRLLVPEGRCVPGGLSVAPWQKDGTEQTRPARVRTLRKGSWRCDMVSPTSPPISLLGIASLGCSGSHEPVGVSWRGSHSSSMMEAMLSPQTVLNLWSSWHAGWCGSRSICDGSCLRPGKGRPMGARWENKGGRLVLQKVWDPGIRLVLLNHFLPFNYSVSTRLSLASSRGMSEITRSYLFDHLSVFVRLGRSCIRSHAE